MAKKLAVTFYIGVLNLWQKNLLMPSTLGFRFVAKKLAIALLVYGSLYYIVAKKLANAFLVYRSIENLDLWQKTLLMLSG